MSISTQIIRLQSAKAGIKTAIEGKGVTVSTAATLSDYPTLIDSIQQGGGASSNDWIQFVEKEDYTATTFDVKQAITSVDIPSGVTTLGNNCFNGCVSLTSVDIPSGITSLPNGCFSSCISLTSITIPSCVTSLGQSCFQYCSGLTSIDIPNSVTSFGATCFGYCNRLTSVTIPSGVTSLNNFCFRDCSGLTSVDIPSGVTSIGQSCFYFCRNLTSVTIHAETPPTLASDVFFNTNANLVIYVPAGSVEDFKAASNWNALKILAIPNE